MNAESTYKWNIWINLRRISDGKYFSSQLKQEAGRAKILRQVQSLKLLILATNNVILYLDFLYIIYYKVLSDTNLCHLEML